MGYEYELLQRFAKTLGVDVEIKVSKDIDEMFRMLENGEGDLIAFNLTVTGSRKEKADFNIAKFEMEQSQLALENQIIIQQNKTKMVLAKIESYTAQHQANNRLIEQTRSLVEAEKKLFSFGESSLFLVNYREQSFLKLLEKRATLEKKINASIAELTYESGLLMSN